MPSILSWSTILCNASRRSASRRSMVAICWPFAHGMYSMLLRERNCCVFFDRYTAVSESITSCFIGPWMPHHESMAAMMESSSLSDITIVCSQRMHTQTIAKTTLSYTKKRSHSTFSLNLSGMSIVATFAGSGFTQLRHTLHVCTMN